jgi:hypothetical protein
MDGDRLGTPRAFGIYVPFLVVSYSSFENYYFYYYQSKQHFCVEISYSLVALEKLDDYVDINISSESIVENIKISDTMKLCYSKV